MKTEKRKIITQKIYNKKLKKLCAVCMIIFTTFSLFIVNGNTFNSVNAAFVPVSEIRYDANNNANAFPESYRGYINNLKQAHPNWTFKAIYNKLDWNSSVNSEASGTYSRVQDSAYSDAWKRLESAGASEYNAGGFVLASKAAVAYTMDPRNFLNEQGVFQFRAVTENVGSDTQAAVNEAMTYTPMKDTHYAATITNVGNSQGVSPMFIVSRIRQETSCDIINNNSICGQTGYYNFFNIGAYDHATDSVFYGLQMAKLKGWNTPEKAISGGVDWMKANYINYGQETVYFQKFDVTNHKGNATTILSWQYMTNINAPTGEAKIAYDGLKSSGAINNPFTFYVPVFDNMPSYAAPYPGETVNEYSDDNTKIRVKASVAPDKLYVRSGAGTQYSIVAKLSAGDIVTRIKKSNNTQWDIVRLNDGTTGYVFREYIEVYNVVTSLSLSKSDVSMKKGETLKLTYTIGPENAENKNVTWSSSNEGVVSVDNGNLTAKAPGEAVITLKAVETGITASCKVKVSANVESITLPKDTYTVLKDEYITITPTILPDNAQNKEYTLKSDNENVVKVEGLKLKGINTGEANVTFTTKDQNKSVKAKVKVIQISDSDKIIFDETKVDLESDNTVSKINLNTKVSDIKSTFTYNKDKYNVEIKNNKNQVLANDKFVGTGTSINLVSKETNDVLQSYYLIVYGDITGDGIVDSMDMYNTIQHILQNEKLNNEFLKAADTNSDFKIDSMDMYNIIQMILKK